MLLIFLAWNGLSFAWSEHPAAAFDALSRLALNAILFLIVFTAIRTERDVMRVFWAFIIGASLATIVGVLTGSGPTPYGEAARISSGSDNANELAAVLVASTALATGLALISRRSPALRTVAFGAAVLSLAGIVLTVSRSGLIALFVAALAAVVFAGRWRPRVLVISGLVIASAVFYFAFLAPETARQRVTTSQEGGHGREDIWRVGWRMVEAHPVRGVGAGNFSTTSIHYLLIQPGLLRRSDFIVDTQKVAHNAYLQAWAETGVIGLALFLGVILGLLACSLKAIRRFERDGNLLMEVLTRAQLIACIGLLTSLFFSSDQFNKQLWLLLAMGPAMLAMRESARCDSARARQELLSSSSQAGRRSSWSATGSSQLRLEYVRSVPVVGIPDAVLDGDLRDVTSHLDGPRHVRATSRRRAGMRWQGALSPVVGQPPRRCVRRGRRS